LKKAKTMRNYKYSVRKRSTRIHIFKIKKKIRRGNRVNMNEYGQI